MESERDRKIRERAYQLWEQGGQSEGSPEDHWLKAEQEFGAGSEGPDASVGSGAAAKAPAKKASRARATAAEGGATKPTSARAGAKPPTGKETGKTASKH